MAEEIPPAPASSQFYPFATSPDIIRSHEKDVFMIGSLIHQVHSIARSLRGARFAHAHGDTIRRLTEILYFALTTFIGNRTLGEEYCDLVQLEDDTLRLPSTVRRAGYILSSIVVPWALQQILPALRRRLRAKLERSVTRQQLRARQAVEQSQSTIKLPGKKQEKKNQPLFTKLRVQRYLLEHLDSITSLSPIYAVSIATFYFTGSYYHLAKRFWGLRYVFTKKVEENEQRQGYEVLGVLLVLQIAVHGILHIRKVSTNMQLQDDQDMANELLDSTTTKRQDENVVVQSIQNPSALPNLPASEPRYDLAEEPDAVPWIPPGQQSKCTLCLESFKDPSVTTCGHVFCWTCVRDWVREKPECPLCRQDVMLSKVLPLRG